MVFQDFDQISERRRLEREQKFRKRVTIAVIAIFFILVLTACGVYAVITDTQNGKQRTDKEESSEQDSKGSSSSSSSSSKDIARVQRVIKTICNGTSFKDTCKTYLDKSVEKDPSSANPKAILRLAIKATDDEMDTVLKKASSFKFESPKEKAAFEDCKSLIKDAKEELKESMSHAGGDIKKLLKMEPELNNWLSAVMSYQQTCIDGFEDGKLKSDMEKTFNTSKELTSNSLAMVSSLTKFLSSFDGMKPSGRGRRLLSTESSPSLMDKDGIPSWVSHEDRRILKKGGDSDKPTPNVTVAKDGSGQFKTITEALNAMPKTFKGRYFIYVKAGIYDETVTVEKKMENVTIFGDGSQKSIITGNKNAGEGVQTFRTASFVVRGKGFMAKAMGFRNTAGPEKHQAVAARVQADRTIFLNCRFEGYQDTLYVQAHRQYYRSCVVAGTVDFIFGDAAAILQNCLILIRKPLENQKNIITAQSRIDEHETTGIVLQNCRIEPDKTFTADKGKFKSYLGRPWKEYSRTIVMESTIEDLIDPEGWLAWEGEKGHKTLYYAEYNNKGGGSSTKSRVKWPGFHVINKEEAKKFTIEPFIQGDQWISKMGAPVHFGLY